MDRTTKKEWVGEMQAAFGGAQILVVAHYKGLTVAEVTALRVKVRAAGASVKVTKNTLAKLALAGTPHAELTGLLKGPTIVAWAAEPVAAAKALTEFAKDNEKLILLGGAFAGKTLAAKEIQALAKLPSLDELRGKIVALLQTPATRIAGVLQAPAGQLARVFGAYAKKE